MRVRSCCPHRKQQQAGKQGLVDDSEAGSRLRGWRIGVPFSTATARTSSRAAGVSHTALASRRECSLSAWTCQAKSRRRVTKPNRVGIIYSRSLVLKRIIVITFACELSAHSIPEDGDNLGDR